MLILNPGKTLDHWATKFPETTQAGLDGVSQMLGFLLQDSDWETGQVGTQQAAYLLATVKHETAGTFQPIDERGEPGYFKKRYGPTTPVGKNLGNHTLDDAARYHGRGYVQLTGRVNYHRFGERLGVDLLENPDLAKHPKIAYQIASLGMRKGLFTGVGFKNFIRPGKPPSYLACRRIINGSDKAGLIAGYAFTIQSILEA